MWGLGLGVRLVACLMGFGEDAALIEEDAERNAEQARALSILVTDGLPDSCSLRQSEMQRCDRSCESVRCSAC